MADHLVDARTATTRKTPVAETGWDMAMVERVVVYQPVNFTGRDSRLNMGTDEVHQLGIKAAGGSHRFALLRVEYQSLQT